jgi:hypothetical protein
MKTLLELILTLPTWVRVDPEGLGGSTGGVTTGGVTTGGVTGVTGSGLINLQTDGCPLQAYPETILHPEHPFDELLPVSQVSGAMMTPSPQVGMQSPCELAENPSLVQVMH